MKLSLPLILLVILTGLLVGGGCSYVEKIKDGKTAYERKRYYQASEMLQDEYRSAGGNMDKMSIAYLIGESNLKFGDIETAAGWFKVAYEGGYGPTALVRYADCLKQMEMYTEAAQIYLQVGQEIQDRARFAREVAICRQARDWKEDATYSPYVIEPLSQINTPVSEYAAFPLGTNEIAFTSDREESTGDFLYAWSGEDFSDVYKANLGNGNVEVYRDNVNLEDNEGTLVISPDGDKMVFCRCFSRDDYDLHCKLLISYQEGSGWSSPEVMSFIQDGINYRHPTFNDSSDVLIFSANIEESTNDYDLYMSRLDEEVWGEPQSLGSRINSQSREGFPFLYKDTLYFSSDYASMGGLDIYSSYVMPNGQWSPRQNLKAPINSGADDFAFVINKYFSPNDSVLQSGYFTSNRGGGMGKDDLYKFEKRKYFPEKEPEPEEEFVYEIELDLRIFQRQYEDPEDPDSKVIMRIPLGDASITVEEDGVPFAETASNQYGILSLDLNPDKTYDFFVSHPGFFTNELVFSTRDLPIDSTVRVQKFEERLLLEKIFLDKEITLENIYYDLDESFIREDAKPTLDRLAEVLKLNPQIKIELSSHTDCRDTDEYNMTLSQARAQSAVDYLVESGVSRDRMVAQGYGETINRVDCECEECTEEEHQANRRTSFKVLEEG